MRWRSGKVSVEMLLKLKLETRRKQPHKGSGEECTKRAAHTTLRAGAWQKKFTASRVYWTVDEFTKRSKSWGRRAGRVKSLWEAMEKLSGGVTWPSFSILKGSLWLPAQEWVGRARIQCGDTLEAIQTGNSNCIMVLLLKLKIKMIDFYLYSRSRVNWTYWWITQDWWGQGFRYSSHRLPSE